MMSRRQMLMMDSLKEYTVTGNPASFNTNVSKPLSQLLIPFFPVQSGTGDPSPENIRPIYGRTLINVTRAGTNLFDGEMENGDISESTGQNSGTSSSRYRSKNYIPVSGSTSYYFHSPGRTGTVRVFGYNADKSFRGFSAWNVNAVNTVAGAAYIRFRFSSAKVSGDAEISINYPSTETDYEPYSGTTIPITFPAEAGTVYGGTLDVTTGVLTVTHSLIEFDGVTSGKKVTDKGSSTSHSNFYLSKTDASLYDTKRSTTVPNEKLSLYGYKCSHGGYFDSETIDSVKFAVYVYIGSSSVCQPRLAFANSEGISTVALCNAWLADQYDNGTPVQIWYALKEEQTYQLTPQQVSTLIGDNVIFSDTNGENTITYLKKG